jgi:hypothetical protein
MCPVLMHNAAAEERNQSAFLKYNQIVTEAEAYIPSLLATQVPGLVGDQKLGLSRPSLFP